MENHTQNSCLKGSILIDKKGENFIFKYSFFFVFRWVNSTSPDKILKDKLDNVEESTSGDLTTTVSSKNSQREWTFLLKTTKRLKAVALLQDAHRNHFSLR